MISTIQFIVSRFIVLSWFFFIISNKDFQRVWIFNSLVSFPNFSSPIIECYYFPNEWFEKDPMDETVQYSKFQGCCQPEKAEDLLDTNSIIPGLLPIPIVTHDYFHPIFLFRESNFPSWRNIFITYSTKFEANKYFIQFFSCVFVPTRFLE